MQQMVDIWGPGLNHHDNLGLYDLGEINEHAQKRTREKKKNGEQELLKESHI